MYFVFHVFFTLASVSRVCAKSFIGPSVYHHSQSPEVQSSNLPIFHEISNPSMTTSMALNRVEHTQEVLPSSTPFSEIKPVQAASPGSSILKTIDLGG